jgi:hypothetical protein
MYMTEKMKVMDKIMAIQMEMQFRMVEGLPGTTNPGTILGMTEVKEAFANDRRKDWVKR